jgi:hypothetical protein
MFRSLRTKALRFSPDPFNGGNAATEALRRCWRGSSLCSRITRGRARQNVGACSGRNLENSMTQLAFSFPSGHREEGPPHIRQGRDCRHRRRSCGSLSSSGGQFQTCDGHPRLTVKRSRKFLRFNGKGATPSRVHALVVENLAYSDFFPAFFTLAHLALANAESLAFMAAENFFLGFSSG